ncbi:maltose ABC transporter permease MalG [Pelagibacterium halotolerans]|uniref:Maltose/maltodextrin transport system permease protein MalG n=1 Tax=Pelagibacterium halotolerans (strain DSM 22347 / JCM 15775 / CGMCC 1.7692 / B2) TaxID=1082931 RepID=G4RAA7_PELHB|nr:maltose ABC transporter permease MalG [Pelagibacterium halotolerans]AEQ50466.1 maltose/maltodextrin ABC transporter, permease protein MalG [Pelagibacterium halotolerans B2]QJR19573.1 maltose ABC transporter permease MalG [Pelagibacterium halotolerans]SDZ87658.1 maltooligosaccharide ABC transporter membrane protein [Pelagibacterium halotolerans]
MIVENRRTLLLKKFAAHGFLIGFIVVIMFPFLMVVSISFREGNFSVGTLIPTNPTLEHWYLALGLEYTRADGTVVQPPYPVLLWMWNSIKLGIISAAGALAIATISAYALSRIRFRGRMAFLDSLLIIQMFPTTLALVALYAIFDTMGGISPVIGLDSHTSLVLVYLSGVMMHIWTIKGYFDSVDPALDKAAAIDGATPWQTFRFVFLPLAVPIMAVVFVLVFIGVVNDYPIASILLRSEENLTLATGSRFYLSEFEYRWGDFAAAAILSGIPITVVFLIAQRYLVSGLSEGSVKG